MSTKLKDPNEPAHAIIEVRGDGSALRNDGVELQTANENPWYVLATVFGEQAEGATLFDYNEELAAKNRRAWNGWFCAGLNKAEREDRAEKVGLELDDLKPLTKAELDEITKLFQNRMGQTAKLPDRTKNMFLKKMLISLQPRSADMLVSFQPRSADMLISFQPRSAEMLISLQRRSAEMLISLQPRSADMLISIQPHSNQPHGLTRRSLFQPCRSFTGQNCMMIQPLPCQITILIIGRL